VGRQIISGTTYLRHRSRNCFADDLESPPDWRFPMITYERRIVHLSCDPLVARWAALLPTTIKHHSHLNMRGPVTLHRLQEPVQHFEIFVFGLELKILLERCRSGAQVAELVIHK